MTVTCATCGQPVDPTVDRCAPCRVARFEGLLDTATRYLTTHPTTKESHA